MNEILTNVVNKAIATLDHIKSAIIRNGVDVPEGSSTATYADKIDEVFDAGADSVAPDIEEQTMRLNDGLAGGNSDAQTMREKIYEEGKAEGIEEGKQSAYDAFWDVVQNYGGVVDYSYFLAGMHKLPDIALVPKYKIAPTTIPNYSNSIRTEYFLKSVGCGYDNASSETFMYDLSDWDIDFSRVISARYAFNDCRVQNVSVDLSEAQDIFYAFATPNRGRMENISIKLSEKCTNLSYAFSFLMHTTTLIISGTIAANGINLQWSNKLSHESLMSFINALKDYSEDTSGTDWLVTLGSTNLAKLTEEEQDIAYNKGWRLA